ncbi:class I SAM-dependent methyltransferase [Iamia sp. SCSIO 61187]|nr:class I SAM-dependent methyltransferase [Iamia sp. SCSIO 61187]
MAWAVEGWGAAPPWRVLDPAVGGGAFLLAVREVAPASVLVGLDVDPGAVAACRAAVPGADVRLGDGLEALPPDLGAIPGTRAPGSVPPSGARFDLVVGNPPFLGQLARATARDPEARRRLRARFGAAAGGYVDAAALFLLAALDAVRPGGRVVLVQPESALGAAHTGAVRRAVEARAEVLGVRELDRRAFAADVDTCALLLERRDDGVGGRFAGDSLADAGAEPTWSPLLARVRGVPEVHLDPAAGTIADVATTTAGFRQHHYALAAHVVEHDEGLDRVATTGMVDPGIVRWGVRPARIGGRTWSRPAVDLTGVAADDPAVASWFRARLRPKVLVAPQTRVVEAAVDVDGAYLPATPLVVVEPRTGVEDPDLAVWLLAAALSAPPVTAWALALTAGTARSRHALKLSARQVGAVPVPSDRPAWVAAAEALREGAAVPDLVEDLTEAYRLRPDDPVVAWYRTRLGAPADRPARF